MKDVNNAEIKEYVEKLAEEDKVGKVASNYGGWQSKSFELLDQKPLAIERFIHTLQRCLNECTKMAGMPEKIINISKKILKKLEKSHSEKNKFDVDENSDLQLSFFSLNDDSYQNIKGELESIDMDNMTPIEALVKLSELKQKINKDDT